MTTLCTKYCYTFRSLNFYYHAMLEFIAIPLILLLILTVQNKLRKTEAKTFLAIVLGDVGHSPRTLSHCTAANLSGITGYLVGYDISPIHSEAKKHINIINIPAYPKFLQCVLPKYPNFLLKAVYNSLCLAFTILFKCYMTKYSKIILQNPPSIPTLAILGILKFICNYEFIIDWHNYGYTIMKANKQNSTFVKLCESYEFLFARLADFHFTVTESMKKDLSRRAGIDSSKITVLYDKPSPQFRSTNHQTNRIISQILPNFAEENLPIIISSTSWTKDEDFSLFFDALEEYENIAQVQNLPKIGVIITGKGPEKDYYMKKIFDDRGETGWNHIRWNFPWLKADDYPKILNAASIGVCLHASSSGLDLPMKVVDMLGSGLPVLALNYQSIEELVIPNINGELFNNTEELLYLLVKYLSNIKKTGNNNYPREQFENALAAFRSVDNSWESEWRNRVIREAKLFDL